MISRSSNILTLTIVVDNNNEANKSGSSKVIKKVAKSKKNTQNLAKFKSVKNSTKCQKSIKNSVKFKISKRLNFLNLAARLAYTQLK